MKCTGAARSLTSRLFLLIVATIIASFSVYAFVSIRTASHNWEQTVHEGAQRFSELIQHSTHYSMLLNRKEDVHHVIRTIADNPGVDDVRIYDKQGVIIFSAHEEEIGSSVDLKAEACVSCHSAAVPLESVPVESRVRIFERSGNGRVLGLINPIENAPECSSAACHAHPEGQSILGVLDVTMSMAEPDRRLATVERQAIVAAVLIALIAGLASAAFLVQVVRRPVSKLISGVERVAAGDLETEIAVESGAEIAHLAEAFNSMTRDLLRARRELETWSEKLEVRLREKTEELGRSQRQIAHMDKMASLGKLAATVAHELNNPLAGILNYAKLVQRTLRERGAPDAEQKESDRYLALIQREALRSGNIVRNLLAFARPSGVRLAPHSIGVIVDRSTMLVAHHMEMNSIRLEEVLPEGDQTVVCDADQVQQALIALFMNAIEAMSGGGTLRVTAEVDEEVARISIADTGAGMPKEVLARIFEPFYTSKDDSEGAGLGLAVVYGIVQRHGGDIDVESELGSGSTFHISLPRKPPPREEEDHGEQRARGGLESTHV